jgi:hypothetical protein
MNATDNLRSAESQLADQINSAASALDQVGNTLPAALDNLKRAQTAAQARLINAVDVLTQALGDVADFALFLAGNIKCELTPTLPVVVSVEQEQAELVECMPMTPEETQTLLPLAKADVEQRESVTTAANAPMRPLTEEEAQGAYDSAVPVSLPPERIEQIVNVATNPRAEMSTPSETPSKAPRKSRKKKS